jgi:hypothetical protein
MGLDCRDGVCRGELEWRAGEGNADERTGVGGREVEWEETEEFRDGDDGGGKAVEMASGLESA